MSGATKQKEKKRRRPNTNNVTNPSLRPVSKVHKEKLQEFHDRLHNVKEGEENQVFEIMRERDEYEKKYKQWKEMYDAAKADLDTQLETNPDAGSSIFGTTGSSSDITSYFKPTKNGILRKLEKEYDALYHHLVLGEDIGIVGLSCPTGAKQLGVMSNTGNEQGKLRDQFEKMTNSGLGVRRFNNLKGSQQELLLASFSGLSAQVCRKCSKSGVLEQGDYSVVCRNCGHTDMTCLDTGYTPNNITEGNSGNMSSSVSKSRGGGQHYDPHSHLDDRLAEIQGLTLDYDTTFKLVKTVVHRLDELRVSSEENTGVYDHKRMLMVILATPWVKEYSKHTTTIMRGVSQVERFKSKLVEIPEPLDDEERTLIHKLFREFQEKYEMVKSHYRRSNILKYEFVIWKLLQVAGGEMMRWRPFINNFKAKDRRVDATRIWKDVCVLNQHLPYWREYHDKYFDDHFKTHVVSTRR